MRELFRVAIDELIARPLRTILTLASFAASMAIATLLLASGRGLEETVHGMLQSLGEGQVLVSPGRTTGVGGVRRSGRRVQIRFRDLAGIESALPSFEGVAPYFDLRGGGASSWRYSIPWSPVRAVTHSYADVRGLPIVEGRWFTKAEAERGEWVTVLNEGLRRIIFRDHVAVGQWVEWRGRRMTVVGVARDEAQFPYILFVPYLTVSRNMADARHISALVARPADRADWAQSENELRRALAGLGGFTASDTNALEIESNREFTTDVRKVSLAFRILVLTIALVSLLLGGLGVANMMVINVTERVREIGLRKALGATPRVIYAQFLLEALLLAGAGGALGLAGGYAACRFLGTIQVSTGYSVELSLDATSVIACFAGLAAAGLLAGLFPARRAAALAPSEALRWE